jgi:hypothetical protein
VGGSRRGGKKFSPLLTTRSGNAVAVNTWNISTWKPALAKAGVIPPRAEGVKAWQWAAAPKDGFPVLRHTYASIMWEAGESVVTLARTLLADDHPRLLCSLHAGGRQQGRGTIDGLLGERGDRLAGRNSPDSPSAVDP